jgi:hypothetical protein
MGDKLQAMPYLAATLSRVQNTKQGMKFFGDSRHGLVKSAVKKYVFGRNSRKSFLFQRKVSNRCNKPVFSDQLPVLIQAKSFMKKKSSRQPL